MAEDLEDIVRSQLMTLRNQMSVLKEYINDYEERNKKLKKAIINDLIIALVGRFEKNEKLIQELDQKIDSMNFKFQENLSKSIKDLREEITEAELSKAIAKLSEDKEIKVSSKALDELDF